MKKYLSILILLVLFVCAFSPCVTNRVVATEPSVDIVNEIKDVLDLYNQFVLVFHECDGGYEYSKGIQYELGNNYKSISTLSDTVLWFNNVPFYRVTDERFNSTQKFNTILSKVFNEKLSSFFFDILFSANYSEHTGDRDTYYFYEVYGQKYIECDGFMYCYTPKSDISIWLRYIDISTIRIAEENDRYYVTAKGASEYRDSKVQENDSVVKMIFDDIDGKLRISDVITVKESNVYNADTAEGVAKNLIEWYVDYLRLCELESDVGEIQYICIFEEVSFRDKAITFGDEYLLNMIDGGRAATTEKIKSTVDLFDFQLTQNDLIKSVIFYYDDTKGTITEQGTEFPQFGSYDGILFNGNFRNHQYTINTENLSVENVDGKIVAKTDGIWRDKESYFTFTIENVFSSADPEYRITNFETVHK